MQYFLFEKHFRVTHTPGGESIDALDLLPVVAPTELYAWNQVGAGYSPECAGSGCIVTGQNSRFNHGAAYVLVATFGDFDAFKEYLNYVRPKYRRGRTFRSEKYDCEVRFLGWMDREQTQARISVETKPGGNEAHKARRTEANLRGRQLREFVYLGDTVPVSDLSLRTGFSESFDDSIERYRNAPHMTTMTFNA